jgi:hypothetical protein
MKDCTSVNNAMYFKVIFALLEQSFNLKSEESASVADPKCFVCSPK